MSSKTIYEIQKNSRDVIRITEDDYNGKTLFSIRIWFEDDSGQMRPSPKGVSISPDKIDDFLNGIRHLEAHLSQSANTTQRKEAAA